MTTGRSLRVTRTLGAALVLAVALTGSASAHRLDECLQAARIAVEPDHLVLELDLTPGVTVAETLLEDIDADGDGALSTTEQDAYVRRVSGLLQLAVDGHRLAITNASASFPDMAALRRGEGTITMRSEIRLGSLAGGEHRVQFRNDYRTGVSVYLANALVPASDRVAVTAQHRTADQRNVTIEYRLHEERSQPLAAWALAALALLGALVVRQPIRAKTAATMRSQRDWWKGKATDAARPARS
jgi:hypothetical protein